MLVFLEILLTYLALIVPVLLSIAYFTVYERHTLAAIQRRQGPNVVGYLGLLQAFSDALKLFLKEFILPRSANIVIFFLAPIFSLGLALSGWLVFPAVEGSSFIDFRLGLLYMFLISSLSVHIVIMAGWSSNSKYAFLGGLRSAAQMISYEVSLGIIMLSLLLISGSLNLTTVIENQRIVWFIIPLFPIMLLFFVIALAETNRHPFDLPEAEAELVSGYNVEYSALGFALFFLAECSHVILMSSLCALLFLGGYQIFFPFIPMSLIFSLKIMFFLILFILVRGALPRYRYDQLMRLGWKVFLPLSLSFFLFYGTFLLIINGVPELNRY